MTQTNDPILVIKTAEKEALKKIEQFLISQKTELENLKNQLEEETRKLEEHIKSKGNEKLRTVKEEASQLVKSKMATAEKEKQQLISNTKSRLDEAVKLTLEISKEYMK